MDDYEPVRLGDQDSPPGGVELVQRPDERLVLIPVAYKRLSADQQEVVTELQQAAREVQMAQEKVSVLVAESRDMGVSWNLIGWSVGTSPQAARQRWMDSGDE